MAVLGQSTPAPRHYAPEILVPIPRGDQRTRLGLTGDTPFSGADVWHLYELSWLDTSGRPVNHAGVLSIPAHSPNTVESKSLKLYLNSLNFHRFSSDEVATATIRADLGSLCAAPVELTLLSPSALARITGEPEGRVIDGEALPETGREPRLAQRPGGEGKVVETLVSHSLRSLCPVTTQPDWGTLVVHYRGSPLDSRALLAYVLSYREHQDFHEHCVERIFVDLTAACAPDSLAVVAYYQRRGGIDITPWRYSHTPPGLPSRMARQ